MHILLVDTPPLIEIGLRARLANHHRVSLLNGRTLHADECSAMADVDLVVHGLPEAGSPLDIIDQATRGTWNLLTTTNARGVVQLSTMRLFETYNAAWAIDEEWMTRPRDEPGILAAHLAEITAREICRSRRIDTRVLRLDRVVSAADFRTGPIDENWLHIDDALTLITGTLSMLADDGEPRWQVVHGVRGRGRYPLGIAAKDPLRFAPAFPGPAAKTWEETASGVDDTFDEGSNRPLHDLPPARQVTVFGAGGPLGAAAAAQLMDMRDIRLRLTDVRSLASFAAAPPQSEGAPRPATPKTPHTEQTADVTDLEQVLRASVGADCLVNCAVVRHGVVAAFRVNVLGAYNVMRAAVATGIGRVVQTGPAQVLLDDPIGYAADRRVASSTPPRSGANLYFLTKLLAQEVCRIFAEQHRIACPTLLYTTLLTPEVAQGTVHPFSISWPDAGRAIAAAATVSQLPEPAPVVHVRAPSPHGRYRESEIAAVLNWEPQDRLERLWMRAETVRSDQ